MIAQEVIVAKSQELHQVVDQLVTIVADAIRDHTPIHKVEGKSMKVLLQAGQKALQLLVDCLGNGDVGQEYQLPDGTTVKRSDEPQSREYVSIFGKIDIQRYVYAQRKGQAIEFAAIDARLALPAGKFSYLLQDWDQDFAMEEPFGQVAKRVEKILGLNQHVDSLEHMNQEMARQADVFQASLPIPPAKEEGEIFVQTADGKGVPIRRPADAPPIMDHQHRTGPKPDRKKMATLGAVYSIDRLVRTPEDVVESLFRDPRQPRPKTPRPHPCHKQMRALLDHVDVNGDAIDGRAAVFGWMSEQMALRHAGSDKPIVCIMDGEAGAVGHEGCVSRGRPDDRHPGPAARHAAIVGCRNAVSSERKSRCGEFRPGAGDADSVWGGGWRCPRPETDGHHPGAAWRQSDQVAEDLRILGKEPRSYALRPIPRVRLSDRQRRD